VNNSSVSTRRFAISAIVAATLLASAVAIALRNAAVSPTVLMSGLLLTQPLIILATACQAFRHKLIIADPRLSSLTALESVVLAGGFNLLIPARLSELLKATYLREQANVPTSVALSAIAVERLTDSAVVLVAAPIMPVMLLPGYGWAIVLAGLGCAALIAVFRNSLVTVAARVLRGRASNFITLLVQAFGERMMSVRFLGGAALGAIALLSSYCAIYLFLEIAGPGGLSWGAKLVVFLAGIAGGAAAILPGAIGSYHAAVTVALASFGVDLGTAFALSVGMHLLQFVLIFPAAIGIAVARDMGVRHVISKLRGLVVEQARDLRAGTRESGASMPDGLSPTTGGDKGTN
jgi:hypothetical protein